ncbi:MAG: cell division protein FtsZ, partial [Candidatus Micrarchaeia archaeon]
QLSKACDTVVIIDNNRLLQYCPNLPMNEAFKIADEVVGRAIKGISDTIMYPSLINIDFADIKATVAGAGAATISLGEGRGADKVNQAIRSTLEHPLLDVDIGGAKGALIHIAGGNDLTLGEATKIGEGITDALDNNASVIWGARVIPEMGDSVSVMAVLTGVQSPMLTGIREEKKPVYTEGIEDIAFV